MPFDELQSKFNESKCVLTVRPWLVLLAVTQSAGTGWPVLAKKKVVC